MAEKAASKHLNNLEKLFAANDPVLQKTVKVYQELDELKHEIGLIDTEETTARQVSWWPLISTLGGYSSAKSDFINRYFNINLHSSRHKFTVLQYTPQANPVTLPGNALDADHRLPFYQISRDIENVQAGEGSKINSYLELITANSNKLKNRLVIDAPVVNAANENLATAMLRKHVITISDLVLVFTDLFEVEPALISETINDIVQNQDSNKFIFVVDHSEINIDNFKAQEIAASWQRRLGEFGIFTGQFLVLSQNGDLSPIDQRLQNLNNDRSYRILGALEKSIRDIDDVVFEEVETALDTWKERCNATTLIVLGFLIMLMLFAEIAMGILDLLLDPILGPAIVLTVVAILTPIHVMVSRVHAKFIIKQLHKRQKQLNIPEDLAGLYEKSLSFWRVLLPTTSPVGKNKKNRKRLAAMIEQTKDLVQALNDQFSHSQQAELYRPVADPYNGENF